MKRAKADKKRFLKSMKLEFISVLKRSGTNFIHLKQKIKNFWKLSGRSLMICIAWTLLLSTVEKEINL